MVLFMLRTYTLRLMIYGVPWEEFRFFWAVLSDSNYLGML